jgi:hypothetical protein
VTDVAAPTIRWIHERVHASLTVSLTVGGRNIERASSPRLVPGSRWDLTDERVLRARARSRDSRARPGVGARPSRANGNRSRALSDEVCAMDRFDEALRAKGLRRHQFEWLLGHPNKSGGRRRLPVDGYWPTVGLVVEYRERQHDDDVDFLDERTTISGTDRRTQRRTYDERRDQVIPAHDLVLVVVRPDDFDADRRGRLRRTRGAGLA